MELTEQFILLQALNPAAAENGRKLWKKASFSALHKTEDNTLYWADCAGSGKNPYHVSIDWSQPDTPVCRCSCPGRQFPCKHALGLMFEQLSGSTFETAAIPQDVADKRAKQAARAAQKADTPPKPKKANTAAQKKKLVKQLEGLDMAKKMVNDLLASGLGTLAGSSAQVYDKLAKDLGSSYLTGPQTAFTRIALTVRTVQKHPDQANAAYAEALRILISLRSTIKKSRTFLQGKLDSGNYAAEDSVLYTYPGEGDRRIRWDACAARPITTEEHAALPALAQPDLAATVKLVKGTICWIPWPWWTRWPTPRRKPARPAGWTPCPSRAAALTRSSPTASFSPCSPPLPPPAADGWKSYNPPGTTTRSTFQTSASCPP